MHQPRVSAVEVEVIPSVSGCVLPSTFCAAVIDLALDRAMPDEDKMFV